MAKRQQWRMVVIGLGALLIGARAQGQGPTVETGAAPSALAPGSTLGSSPGAMSGGGGIGALSGGSNDSGQAVFGGRAGASAPRVPLSVMQPGNAPLGAAANIAPPAILPATELPVYGSLDIPAQPADEGPPNGLTLEQAIEVMLCNNLTLRSQFYEIPQAQADILTASLRGNPVFYADTQLVPYGRYDDQRPGGPAQYDVNVTMPLDLNHKRQARMAVAGRAKQVLEAQYQDAVRRQIDNLYTTFVDVLAARETVRFSQASVEGLEALLVPLQQRQEKQLITLADVNRVRIQLDFAKIGLNDAQETLRKSQINLGTLLNTSPAQAMSTELRGTIQDRSPQPPAEEVLTAMALQNRPDLLAYRLGVERARAEVRLAEKNKWSDVYWLVQPYTFQDQSPFGTRSSTSWATGVTVPLPIMNRNQGNIQRANLNVTQTQLELAALERAVVADVLQAVKDYQVSRNAVEQIEQQLLPAAQQVLKTVRLQFDKGQVDAIAWLNARRDFNEVVRQYRDVLVRHRRSMLSLNTAVGQRLMP